MGSISKVEKPHAICIPFPAQGHINPMLKLAKLLYSRGFHITFVNTEYNHKRLIKSKGFEAVEGLPSFRFETIPDGLMESDDIDSTQDIPYLAESTSKTCLDPFMKLIKKLNDRNVSNVPPVSRIVADGCMSFALLAAEQLGIPVVFLWTTSACGFACYMHFFTIVQSGLSPLEDDSYLTNGYMETMLDLPGMDGLRLKDIPTFIRTTNPDDIMLNFVLQETERSKRASAIVLNTFEELEYDVVQALSTILPPIYTIGPLHLLENYEVKDESLKNLGANLWKEDSECLEWLDLKSPDSVVYVNFGSITTMTPNQLVEFAWGLANSGTDFLWIIRPNLVSGDSCVLPSEFMEVTKERGMLGSWCPQEKVLSHPSVGGFLTHNGWNSTLETLASGVPMVCWPFFAEQQTNCWYSCNKWGVGMEIDNNVKRDEVQNLVRELMTGEKGRKMKTAALEWKKKLHEAASGPKGFSYLNLDQLINKVLT
ncbi:transferase [Lithospermum erythrorhizon]|uniref:7-deoxyloganetin glucosyltransferase n=1 Tax=Lithospermum erythrorhizon TaxID=34254 RepID=A0AAV3R0F8_LITER